MNLCKKCKHKKGLNPQSISELFIYDYKCKLCIDNPNLISFYEVKK